ncbi:hypothetical protein QOS04_18105 [Cupriavidus sp. LEh21]|nr:MULTISPECIES: hypothetical protein [unclassified Cupriavidus]MDK2658497.1 hypothetical protein [Cupriavidus sp. LEh21]
MNTAFAIDSSAAHQNLFSAYVKIWVAVVHHRPAGLACRASCMVPLDTYGPVMVKQALTGGDEFSACTRLISVSQCIAHIRHHRSYQEYLELISALKAANAPHLSRIGFR